jgi:ABC-type glycerol-3-phosphate transport system substrate-binding protein
MVRSIRKYGLLAALLVLAAVVMAACAVPVAPPPAAAPPAGDTAASGETQAAASTELNLLCTPQVQWCEGMKAEFEKAHPDITVNFVRMSSGESLTRLRNEKDNPQFDIWWGGPIDSFVAAPRPKGCWSLRFSQPGQSGQPGPDQRPGQRLGRRLHRLAGLCHQPELAG